MGLYYCTALGASTGTTQKTCLKQALSLYSTMKAGPHFCGQFIAW